ncbi:MAG: NADPH-dependent 7-cyano-7-deazaguanine reductase QueF [Calditrichaeota bacterium]|jgi:7-cyano-7-deazaguanine reductase|nr:NADPH-dependent 7-cyano-7-deazaguanine reductase QueF [Calditrichota bacterium]MBT7617225.1 NADPH-dependent 7-cyano-7-deazaguanine reductase QueF [Calditrichota bacterium]MBT7789954.1 NADPH-dependent 7-cyano-7-deazaguanine reductase QueF [Calditrichota bacterium]
MDIQPQGKTLPFDGYDAIDTGILDIFPYEYSGREIELEIGTEEFTSVCPFSGLPDFGMIAIYYVPDKDCIELRSLKYYLLSYRNVGIFYEHLVPRILEDLVKVCKPISMTVEAEFTERGGLKSRATATWDREDEIAEDIEEEV